MKSKKLLNGLIFIIIFIAVMVGGMHVWINILSNQVSQDQKKLNELNTSSVISSRVNDDITYYKKSIDNHQKEIDLLHKLGFR